MATTAKGIYYPTSSDAVAPLESVFSAMASSIDTALPLSGITDNITFSVAAGGVQDINITIPTQSTAPQKVLVTVRGPSSGSSSYIATVTNSGQTSISVRVYRLGGTTGNQQIKLAWAVLP